jgi:hypothetical protein
VVGDFARRNCVFDVLVTGNPGFAEVYEASGRARANATRVTVVGSKARTRVQEPVAFIARVAPVARSITGAPAGEVRFLVDGRLATSPLTVDASGQAVWQTADLTPGRHLVSATYLPGQGSTFSPSASAPSEHDVQPK